MPLNRSIDIMQANGIKDAAYMDITQYNMYYGDKNGSFHTRDEITVKDPTTKEVKRAPYKPTSTDITLPNQNVLILESSNPNA